MCGLILSVRLALCIVEGMLGTSVCGAELVFAYPCD